MPVKKRSVGSGGKRRKGLKPKGPTPSAARRRENKGKKTTRAPKPRKAPTLKKTFDLIIGRNPTLEALKTQVPASSLRIANGIDIDERIQESIRLANEQNIPIVEMDRRDLDRITDHGPHQGIALGVKPYEYRNLDKLISSKTNPIVVILDQVTDPRNLGAIIRSGAAFDVSAVVVGERRSVGVNAAVWKAAAGALAHLPVSQVVNIARTISELKKQGFFILGLSTEGAEQLPELDKDLSNKPLAIVVGSEGKGISRLVAEHCDLHVSIPITSKAESLNASVAASIVLYQIAVNRAIAKQV